MGYGKGHWTGHLVRLHRHPYRCLLHVMFHMYAILIIEISMRNELYINVDRAVTFERSGTLE